MQRYAHACTIAGANKLNLRGRGKPYRQLHKKVEIMILFVCIFPSKQIHRNATAENEPKQENKNQ
jgi:hypothetical protein